MKRKTRRSYAARGGNLEGPRCPKTTLTSPASEAGLFFGVNRHHARVAAAEVGVERATSLEEIGVLAIHLERLPRSIKRLLY